MPFDNEPTTETPDPNVTAQPVAQDGVAAPAAAPESATTTTLPETPAAPTSALDAALKALDKGREDASATAAKPAGVTTETDTAQTAAEDAQDESLADVPKLPPDVFSALPREARTAFNTLRKQIGTLRPDAERGQSVARFIRESGVTPQEFMELQDVGALMKRDPAKAREVLVKHLDRIDTHLGLKLPDDIRKDVDEGFMSEERASELSRTRAEAEATKRALAERDQAAAGHALGEAVTSWETQMRTTDPDFGRKLPSIKREVLLTLQERAAAGNPVRSPDEAVEIAKAAAARVDELLAPFKAPAAATRREPSSAASAPATSKSEPTSVLEAAWAGLKRGRG